MLNGRTESGVLNESTFGHATNIPRQYLAFLSENHLHVYHVFIKTVGMYKIINNDNIQYMIWKTSRI